jgi:hypothetical protein
MVIQLEELSSKKSKNSDGTSFLWFKLGIYWAVQMRDYEDTYTAYFDNKEESMQVYNMMEYHEDGFDLPFIK